MTKIFFSFIIVISLCSKGIARLQLLSPSLLLQRENNYKEVIMKEEWRDIPGYKGLYQVSNIGKIKSLERYVKSKNNSNRIVKELVRKNIINSRGYHIIGLCKNNKMKIFLIHRLVAQVFISNPENKSQINHKNGIKTDNEVTNLEWCTSSENIIHSYKNELQIAKKGENHYRSKLKKEDVIKIKKMLKNNKYTQKEIANKFNVSRGAILSINLGKNWKHIKI